MNKLIVTLALLVAAPLAFAYDFPVGLAGQAIDDALKVVMNNLETMAFKILFGLAVLQFVITGYGLIASGEVDATMAKFAKMLIWVAFCVWLLYPSGNGGLSNGGHFIQSSVSGFISLAGSWTATQGSSFNTTDIMFTGIKAYGDITASVAKTTATNAVNAVVTLFVPGIAILTLMMTFAISLVVLLTSGYVALKVFMVKIELSIIVAIAPLSMAFLGLTALREQGFAPFKSMLALIYRIVVLGAVVSGMATISKFLSDYVDNQAYGLAADVWSPLIAAAFGFVLLAFVAHKSDSISASLSNGSASLGSGDVAGAAAMGASMGAALATGGASAAGGATKAVSSVSEMMKNLAGGGGPSVSNAGGSGGGSSSGGGGTGARSALMSTSLISPPGRSKSPAKPAATGPEPGSAAATGYKPHPLNNFGDSQTDIQAAKDFVGTTQGQPKSAQQISDFANTLESPKPSQDTGLTRPESAQKAGIQSDGTPPAKPKQNLGSDKKSGWDHVANLNQHVAQERAATHVSINTHHSD